MSDAIRDSLEVIIFIGLPGSGKSSFYRARFAATHWHLSKDNWPNAKKREARLQHELRNALHQNQSVVVDNTNVTREARRAVLEIAHEFAAHVIGYVFEPNLEDCLRRNATRIGKARVPDVAIKVMRGYWQNPARNEGFDELFQVRLQGSDFIVTNYDEPTAI